MPCRSAVCVLWLLELHVKTQISYAHHYYKLAFILGTATIVSLCEYTLIRDHIRYRHDLWNNKMEKTM